MLNNSQETVLITFKHPKRPETTAYLEKLKIENPELYKIMKKPACPLEMEISNKRYPLLCNEEIENCSVLNPNEFKFNKDKCSIDLTLESGRVVKLFDICCTYTGVKEDKRQKNNKVNYEQADDNIYAITIKSPHATFIIKGLNC